MRQKMNVFERPSVWPEYASVSSNASNAPRTVRYIRGKMTTMVAKMADHHVMTSLRPKVLSTHAPTMRFGPSTRKRRYPTTVGGSTSGSVRMTSSTPLRRRGSFAM